MLRRSIALIVMAAMGAAACQVAADSGPTETKQPQTSKSNPAAASAAPVAAAPASSAVAAAAAPADDRVGSALKVDLGPVATGQTVELDLPNGALGFDIVVQSSDSLGIQRVESPTGSVVLDNFTPVNSTLDVGTGSGGVAAISIPDNDTVDQLSLPKGKWKITVGGSGTGGQAMARVQTTTSGSFDGGTLDIHVHIPLGLQIEGHTVTEQSAPSDAALLGRLNVFFNVLKSAYGIDRGTVTVHTAPAQLVTVEDDTAIDQAGAVDQGMTEDQTIHILLTNDLQNGDLLGLSPGIPGASIPGTAISGVIVALYGDSTVQEDGNAWLHEVSHFIGLQHTSEVDGQSFDPLSDTPECPQIVNGNDAACPDESNLMYPTITLGMPTVSTAQRAIFQSSSIYHSGARTGAALRALFSPPTLPSSTLGSRATTTVDRLTITKSGRPLSGAERWLGSTFCGATDQSPRALIAAKGSTTEAIRALDGMARDTDLPQHYQRKAQRLIDRILAGRY